MLTKTPGTMLAGFQPIPLLTSVNAIKSDSLNPDDYPIVRLRTNGRDQEFEWLAGNYTTRVAADVYNGRYIKKDAVSATDGAWVALPRFPGSTTGMAGRFQGDTWRTQEFGVPRNDQDAAADPAPYFAAMWNLANIDKPGTLKIDLGLYTLSARFPTLSYQGTVEGSINKGFQSTGLIKNYTEADAHIGIMPFGKYGTTLRDLNFGSAAGVTAGGSAYSFILDGDDTGPGDTFIDNVFVSALACNNGMYIDGRLAISGTAQGYRQIVQRGCQFLNSASYAIEAYGVHHWFSSDMLVANVSGGPALKIDSDVVTCDDIHMRGIVAGKMTFGKMVRCVIITPVGADIENTANTVDTVVIGPHYAGTVQSNWTGNSGLISPA